MSQLFKHTGIKGRLFGKCNRTVCERIATWWSTVERACYCKECAEEINRHLPKGVKHMYAMVTVPHDSDDTQVHFTASAWWYIPRTAAVEHPYTVLRLHRHGDSPDEQCIEMCTSITRDEARGLIDELTAWLDRQRTH